MKIYKTKKIVLSLKNNAAEFLNGITSNSLEAPDNAFVNLHGRIIATFDQIRISSEEIWVCLEAPFVETVLQHIDRYARLAGVVIERLMTNVYFDLEGHVEIGPADKVIARKNGRLIITDKDLSVNVSEQEFTLFRLKNNIPLHGTDYRDDFLLNVSETNFVSFTKGCYLGQEPISKVHHRSHPTWKLIVKAQDACDDEEKLKMTSKTLDPATNNVLGFVFVSNKD